MKLILPDPELFWVQKEDVTTGQTWFTLRIRGSFCSNYYVATIVTSPSYNEIYYWQSYSFDGGYLDTGICKNLKEAKEAAISSLVQEKIITLE